jgi:putative Mg2+ transporter-C (MgtC) family protein
MYWYDILIRLALATLVGGIIGYDRENKNRPAGFRTHILVCVGAAVVTMTEINMTQDAVKQIAAHPELASAIKTDMGRFGAQVITGIGFLGAGTILHDKGSIKGLTTAASIWVVACIGLAVGSGYYFLSLASVSGVYVVLAIFKKFESKYIDKNSTVKLEIEFNDKVQLVKSIEDYFDRKKIKVKNIEFLLEEEIEEIQYEKCQYTVLIPKYYRNTDIIQELCELEAVVKVNII